MKVNFDSANYNKKVNNSLAFKGYKPTKTDEGNRTGEFSYPFDPATTDCYLEVAVVDRDRYGNYFLTGDKYIDLLNDTEEGRKLYPGKNRINIHAEFGIMEDEPFAYHYKLVNKKTGDIRRYGVDAGSLIDSREDKNDLTDENLYNLYVPSSDVSRGGSMLLLIPDSYDPKWIYDADNDIVRNENYDELRHNIRVFSNKMGGSLAGLEKRLEQGAMDPYDRIVSLPLFTDDSRTHHAYWNKNCMQMAHSIGNINNYTSLTKALFAKGKSLVSDGAFVNEGLEGIHFNHALKWKEQSPFFDWFRMDPDTQVLFGVFTQNTEFLTHRLVNPKYFYKQNSDGMYFPVENTEYNHSKPTYFEIYDKDLVKGKLNPQEPIEAYNKDFYDNPMSKATHNDTVIPYRFPIDVKEYDINVKQLNEYNKENSAKIGLYSGLGTKFVATFSNMQLDNKIEGNIDTWGSNFDIAKIHYFLSSNEMDRILAIKPGIEQQEEVKKLQYAANEARDYVVTSARFWTRKTNQILNLYVAQNLKHIDEQDPKEAYKTIIKKVNSGVFPQRLKNNLSEDAVRNIMEGTYDGLKGNSNTNDFRTQVAQYMMNYPLDSIELGDDISAVLSTPYISKRSYREEYIGQPDIYTYNNDDVMTYDRFFLNKVGNPHLQNKYEKVYRETNNLFIGDAPYTTGPLTDFAIDIIDRLNNDKERPANEKIYKGYDNTEYGNYVLPYLAEEILKYAVIKSLCPAPRFQTNDNGDISYDYDRLKKLTLKDIGVSGISPEDEAHKLIKRIKSGLDSISESDKEALADALKKKLKGTTAESFRLAEAIVDRSQAGLDWRIDAAKDVADIDALREEEGGTDFDTIFEQVTSFWEKFAHDVLKENPNSYMVAELTDMNELYDFYGKDSKRYPNKTNLIGKFLTDSGLTTVANYDYFFSTLPEMFSKNFNNGQASTNYGHFLDKKLHLQMVDPVSGFLRSAPLQSLMFSYTFLNNHDNTRALHALALDMDFFHGFKNNWTGHDYREEAVKLITGDYDDGPANIENFDLSRYSSKDLAMVSALKKGFMDEIDEMADSEMIGPDRAHMLKEAIRKSLTDIANKKFKGIPFEAGSFGVKPIDMAIDFTLENACNNGLEVTDKELNILSEKVFERIMKPAYQKYNAMMEFLVALPGNPTLYSGDELGSTGYEYETKNVTLQNRAYLHNEWVDKHSPDRRKFVVENNNNLRKIMYQRRRSELQALNDGAIFALKLQEGHYGSDEKKVEIPTILRENTAGYMTISLLNTSGLDKAHEPTAELIPNKITLNQIDLSADERKRHQLTVGLPAGLPLNTIFFDSGRDNTDLKHIYTVEKDDKNQYCIKHRVKDADGRYKEAPIEIEGNTMILYHDPKRKIENLSFKGKKFLYNPQFNYFGASQNNLYTAKKDSVCGEKLSLVSR